ncbi:MAG TPA: substrate-binding domain-containing protein [Leptolyngbyaceae cyanobacterium]
MSQLIYTSFAGRGFSTLASARLPIEIQQTFMQRLVSQYWDSYNPPASGYRAVFLHQISPESTLFGWLYNDGTDDLGRGDVPLFVCYYITEPLFDFQLANIFICLEKGPVAVINRHNPSARLETKVIPDLWSYQPARPGVAITLAVRQRSYFALRQGELLELFVPVNEQEPTIDLSQQTYEQQIATLSIYTRYIIDGLNLDATILSPENVVPNQTAIQAYQSYKQKLHPHKQVLGNRNQRQYQFKTNTRSLLYKKRTTKPIKNWLPGENVALNTVANVYKSASKSSNQTISARSNLDQPLTSQISNESNGYDSEQAHKRTQLLLKIGIAAAALALAFGIYGLRQASVSGSGYNKSSYWAMSPFTYKMLADVTNVPLGKFKYGGSTSFAPLRSPAIVSAIAIAHPQFKLIYTDPIPHKHGSAIGIKMLLAGQLSFAQSSRPIKETELKQAQQQGFILGQIPVAIDGIAFYVNPQVSIPGLTLNQIRDIFIGKINNWKLVGGPDLPIILFSRNPQYSGTAHFIKTKVLAGAEFSPNVRQVETTTDSIRLVAKIPGGISYATASEVIGQKSIDPLSLAIINPLPLSLTDNKEFISPFDINNKDIVNSVAFANGSYPLTRRLFIIIKRNGGVDEQAGIAYANLLFSEEGQLMLQQAGFAPIR